MKKRGFWFPEFLFNESIYSKKKAKTTTPDDKHMEIAGVLGYVRYLIQRLFFRNSIE